MYDTMKKAYDAAIKYLDDLIVELTSENYYTKHIEEERDTLIQTRKRIGTKYQMDPDKFYLGHDVSIIPKRV
jgi:hypothetical protein